MNRKYQFKLEIQLESSVNNIEPSIKIKSKSKSKMKV